MRPRLASLALLLLALCRSASAGAAVTWGDELYTADSAVTLDATAKTAELAKLLVDPTKYAALASIVGNSLHALMLKGAGKFDALPDYYKKALVNGVRCEVADADTVKNIVKEQYGATDGKVPAAKITEEKDFAKANHGIDCADTTKADPCLCTANKEMPLIYCLAKKHFTGAPEVACKKAVIDELKNFGKKALGKILNQEIAPPTAPPADQVMMFTQNENPVMADAFCDASDPAVLAITAKLYASNGLPWTEDAAQFAQQGSTFDKACETDQVKNTDRGKCMCSKTTGLSVCMMVNMGTLFKNKGYLDCAPTPAKFDSAKKDSVKADLVAYLLSGNLPSSNPAPGPGAPTPANETTTAATGGAATSSLLLAPLAAAAAAMLLL